MINPSAIPTLARTHIGGKLQALANDEGVRLILAIESGSRAWGFPSQDSDYEVRFIYARRLDDYLSIESTRDVIETPLLDDSTLKVPLDMNGWDVRKVLGLAMQSNSVLFEWVSSPIKYIYNEKDVLDLVRFAKNQACPERLVYHYDRLARNSWENAQISDGGVKLKVYCYVLRSCLCLEWLRRFKTPPPMDMFHLCDGLGLSDKLVIEISNLIWLKGNSEESECVYRNIVLDEFLESSLSVKVTKPKKKEIGSHLLAEANKIFRHFIAA